MKAKIIKYGVALLIILGLSLFVLTQVLGQKTVYKPRPAYDKTGFIENENYSEDEITLENTRFKLTLKTEDTNFELLDKVTNQIWYSTPKHDTLIIPADARELFVLYYERKIEASKMVSINDESIKYNNYQFRVKDNQLEVLYEVGGKHNLMMSDLPRQIGKETFERLILEPLEEKGQTDSTIRRQLGFLKAQFNYVENDKRYYLKELTSQDSIDIVYNLIFNESLYTYDQYIEDSITYGFETSKQLPYFEFSVTYQLTSKGLEVRLNNDSIVESEDFPIAYIDLLPFFGSGNLNDEGFTVLPDGSGVYIDHNNQKYNTVGYEKRIYGSDMSVGTAHQIKPSSGERLSFAMYGYAKNDYGFINVIKEGDHMTTLKAGFLTESSNGVYVHKIPYANYRYFIRERDAFIFQSSTSSQRVTSWSIDYNKDDFVFEYQFIEESNLMYYDMVKAYQTHLVDLYQLEEITKQKQLHVTLLGGYLEKKYFLGFPYTSVEALTSTKGVRQIKDDLIDLGIDQFDMTYQGFSNNGVKPSAYLETDYNKNITSRKALEKLVKDLNKEEIDLFLEFSTTFAYTDQHINVKKDVTENIFHKPVYRYPYDEATLLADKSKTISYVLNTSAQNRVFSNVIKTSNRLGATHISLTDFGQSFASNLNKKETMFRNEIALNQMSMMNRLEDKSVQLRNPNQYLIGQASQILDLSLKGTMHPIVDFDIPFIPLVLNGYMDFAGNSVNMDDSKSIHWHLLKAIETGASLQFSFTAEETTKLVKTEYNYLISTYYKYWLEDLSTMMTTLDDLNILNQKVINHQVLNPQGSIVEVNYRDGKTIRINYETESYVVMP